MITFITPTYKRDEKVLRRCLDCVEGQGFKEWTHLVIADDAALDGHVSAQVQEEYTHERRRFIALGHRSNNYGNTPRQLGIELAATPYVIFLDDDNVIFPNYCSVMLRAMREASAQMVVCRIIHMGPLPQWLCPPPKVLDGNPAVLQNIDTLQVCVDAQVAKREGWMDKGYMADGHTLEAYAKACKTVHIDDILGVHMCD